MNEPTTLTPFEGRQVLSTGIEIPGAAGGLRDSLAVDPFEGHQGTKVFVLLETTVDKLRFDPVKDTDGWKRVHILAVELGLIVDAQDVEAMVAAQRVRIAEHAAAKEASEKGGRIVYPTDEELLEAHTNGDHADALIEGCVECQREVDLEAKEKADAEDLKTELGKATAAAAGGEVNGSGDGPPPVNRARAAAEKKAAAKKAPAKKAAAKKAPAKRPAGPK